MSEWREVVLGDVCSLIVDSEHKTAPKDPAGWHPLIRTTDLGRARADFAGAQRVGPETYDRWTKRAKPAAGDLILAREAPVGGVCRVPDDVDPVLGQRTVLIRPDVTTMDSSFLMYRLAAADMQARMSEMATGSTVAHLNMADIRSLTVPTCPPLPTQCRVARVLSAIDELAAVNDRRIALLKDLTRALYSEWFVRLRFPGHADQASTASDLGPIPDGWTTTDLGSTARWLSGGTPSTNNSAYWNGETPWISSGSLTSMLLDTSDRRLTPAGVEAGSRTVDRDALLFVVRGMSLVREFRVGIAERTLAFGQDCKALIAQGVDPLYLAFTVFDRQSEIQGMTELAGHGTGKLSTDRLKSIRYVLPPDNVQARFAASITPMREEMATLVQTNRALARTRDLLLPRLVTGRLDISDIDLGDLLPEEAA